MPVFLLATPLVLLANFSKGLAEGSVQCFCLVEQYDQKNYSYHIYFILLYPSHLLSKWCSSTPCPCTPSPGHISSPFPFPFPTPPRLHVLGWLLHVNTSNGGHRKQRSNLFSLFLLLLSLTTNTMGRHPPHPHAPPSARLLSNTGWYVSSSNSGHLRPETGVFLFFLCSWIHWPRPRNQKWREQPDTTILLRTHCELQHQELGMHLHLVYP